MTVRLPDWDNPPDDTALLRAAISDVSPAHFRDRIDQRLGESTLTPGLLTRLVAQVTDRDTEPAEIERYVVGVQFIYEGLTLTRKLARYPSWSDESTIDADLDILVADVLVARGFSLLARTEAMPKAVEIIRTFGRDETSRHVALDKSNSSDCALEVDVYELSIIAGVTATGAERPIGTHTFASNLAEANGNQFDDRNPQFSEPVVEELHELVTSISRRG